MTNTTHKLNGLKQIIYKKKKERKKERKDEGGWGEGK